MEEERGPAKKEERIVYCIGDIHGYISKLQNLWSNLESAIDPPSFQTALIIFLGDYCDRGPDTRKVLDFLISLPSKYPNQTHVFLCGNHDFAFAAFVKVLPLPPDGSAFSETWKEYDQHEEKEGWFKGFGFEDMHLQGRRWAGVIKERFNKAKGMDYMGSIYDAGPTFESYGVPHGSAELVTAVPDEHKKFLADLVWVHEEDDVCIEIEKEKKHCKLVAVHAGLEKAKGVEEQLKLLKVRDTKEPKVQALSGRKNVLEIPKELCEKPTIVVSGHHGKLFIEGLRLVIDEGGGLEKNAIAAIILPSMRIVRDTDAKSVLHGGESTEDDEITGRPIFERDAATSQASSNVEYAEKMRSANSWQEESRRFANEQTARQAENTTYLKRFLELREIEVARDEASFRERMNTNDDYVMAKDLKVVDVEDHNYWIARKAEVRQRWGLERDHRHYG